MAIDPRILRLVSRKTLGHASPIHHKLLSKDIKSTVRAPAGKLESPLPGILCAGLCHPRLNFSSMFTSGAPTSLTFKPGTPPPDFMGGVNSCSQVQISLRHPAEMAYRVLQLFKGILAASKRNLGPAPLATEIGGTNVPSMAINIIWHAFRILHQCSHNLLQSQGHSVACLLLISLCALHDLISFPHNSQITPFLW